MSEWFAAHTQAKSEEKAAQHLMRQGFSIYLPRYMKRRSHSRKVDFVPAPLFPRYIFIAMDIAITRWRAISSTVGISHLICNGNKPVCVPTSVIEAIRAQENKNGYVSIAESLDYHQGQSVDISSGPFQNLTGIFEVMTDNERVTVLLEILGRQVRAHVPLEALRPAS